MENVRKEINKLVDKIEKQLNVKLNIKFSLEDDLYVDGFCEFNVSYTISNFTPDLVIKFNGIYDDWGKGDEWNIDIALIYKSHQLQWGFDKEIYGDITKRDIDIIYCPLEFYENLTLGDIEKEIKERENY